MQKSSDREAPRGLGYEAPLLTVIGSVHQLTQVDKKYGPTDGNTFMGDPIANNSG